MQITFFGRNKIKSLNYADFRFWALLLFKIEAIVCKEFNLKPLSKDFNLIFYL